MILANNQDKNSWSLELFINPDKILVLTVLSISAVLLITGVIIVIIHLKEKKEDSKNRP
jgi:hypothetical protein